MHGIPPNAFDFPLRESAELFGISTEETSFAE
jgi:hypothetical protein